MRSRYHLLPVLLVGLLASLPAAAQAPLVPRLTSLWTGVGDSNGAVDQDLGTASVESAEFSPDGARIVAGSKLGREVTTWDVTTGARLWTQTHEEEVEVVAFTRDGRYVASGGEDRTVRVWDAAAGTAVATLPHEASIDGMRFSHDGTRLATGDEGGRIQLWDTSNPDPSQWPTRPIAIVFQGPDQDRPDGGSGHSDVNSIDWSTDDRFLVTAGRNAVVKRWEVAELGAADGGLRQTYSGFNDSVKSTRLSPDGRYVAAGGQRSPDGLVLVWDVASAEQVTRIDYPMTSKIEAVEWTPDGRFLFTGGVEGSDRDGGYPGNGGIGHIRAYDAERDFALALEHEVFRQEYFDFTADGTRLVSSHEDGTLRVWQVEVVEKVYPLLNELRPHPRLLLTPEVEARLEAALGSDPFLGDLVGVVRQYAEAALAEPVVQHRFDEPNNPPNTRRLKAERRASMFRVLNLALAYRLTDDARYLDRAKADLLAAAQFPDWWPPHFLNVGEFSALVALGYDWLYDSLTDEERATIREGLVRNGLEAGLDAYGGAGFGWWRNSDNNWNQVCNAGLALAALAVAEDAPDAATAVLDAAVASIPRAMESYLPDGAWEEGPTYWAYGTTYNALLLAGLESALGELGGLDAVAGYEQLARSGLFHIQTVGPTNRYFDFGDAKDVAYFSPVLFWMARHYDRPVYAWFERELVRRDLERMRSGALMQDDTLDRFLALLVVWYSDAGQDLSYDDLAYDAHFDGTAQVGAFRSGWTGDALYLGFKGGTPQAEHAHMDLGTFVLDADGVRWALDLGGDDYGLPGYFDFGGPRWDYFRLNNHGHNTLVLGSALQNPHAMAPITAFESRPDRAHAVLNLSDAYAAHAVNAERGFALLDRSRVMVQDRLRPLFSGFEVQWQMLTEAAVALDGPTATLTQDGRTLRAEILEPAGATFEVLDATPSDAREDPNAGVRILAVRQTADYRAPTELTVLLTPVNAATANLPPPAFRPLGATTTAAEGADVPGGFRLAGNAPNPFYSRTHLDLRLPAPARVHADVFDLLGRRVLTTPAVLLPAGQARFPVDASALPAGVYVYRVVASGAASHEATGRFTILR